MSVRKVSNVSIDIKYFNPGEQIKIGNTLLVIGRRGAGKSVLAADILSYFRYIKRGLVISATENANSFWGQYVPECFIHTEFKTELVEELFKTQEAIKKHLGYAEPALCILDDMMWNRGVLRSPSIEKLFFNGRHHSVLTLVLCQDSLNLPPSLRTNCDIVMLLQDPILRNRERVFSSFGGPIPSFEAFDSIMRATTENREALVVDMRQHANAYKINEAAFFYKANPKLRYRIGSEKYCRFSEEQQCEKELLARPAASRRGSNVEHDPFDKFEKADSDKREAQDFILQCTPKAQRDLAASHIQIFFRRYKSRLPCNNTQSKDEVDRSLSGLLALGSKGLPVLCPVMYDVIPRNRAFRFVTKTRSIYVYDAEALVGYLLSSEKFMDPCTREEYNLVEISRLANLCSSRVDGDNIKNLYSVKEFLREEQEDSDNAMSTTLE